MNDLILRKKSVGAAKVNFFLYHNYSTFVKRFKKNNLMRAIHF